jgi:putative ABC transport system substrate-binding protein
MKKKITAVALCALLFALCVPVEAQQPVKTPRIGMLVSGSVSSHKSRVDAFRQGLRDLGYVEQKNILIEVRYAEEKRDRIPELTNELVRLKADVIVTGGTETVRAAMRVTNAIPIVAASAGDLVRAGVVASLARPGGNVTGPTLMSPELSGKRLELLKEANPKISHVAVLWNIGADSGDEVKQTEVAAESLKLKIQSVEVRDPSEFESAYGAMTKQQADAVIIIQNGFILFHHKKILELAVKNRLPSMCELSQYVESGCLMGYGPSLLDSWRRAATYVDKILKGAKPADLPVEQPTKFEFVVNLKTAKQIGLTIPPNVLARADKVIK